MAIQSEQSAEQSAKPSPKPSPNLLPKIPPGPGGRSPDAPDKPACVRERILATARDSFYREGIRAVGVDTLIARSGVAKMSFYRSFRSKDDLVCAYLESEAAEYWQWWDG